MNTVTERFGSLVFDDCAMQERLPEETYRAIQRTIKNGRHLDLEVANVVANAMKDWAIEKGATHYTHWFQPLTGITAEKHDSFISPAGNGKIIMDFSGKELVKGESDASSLPSGGLRATFEARGYTAWDPTSYAFIKGNTLCIPTAFCSYGGHALDKKTPLLRSMELLNKQALRILRILGHDEVSNVKTTVGAEQEYFLVDRALFDRREDLIFTGRTLFGAKPPKGQELEDHYYGSIKPRVAAFMAEVDEELWKLGVLAKTEHNEVAPSQHELAPIYTTTNIAADHNQLTMEVLRNVARKHDLVCLLHEKPFDYVNGSGKHNNWSISTDTGVNLLEPGETPAENAQFLLFLCAVIAAVDDYPDLLRVSVASAGNDHRLGTSEAPPAIISVYLGDELSEVLKAIETETPFDTKEKELLRVGVHTLPKFPKDSTDRNRTSPFAFTGNKFEFRMVGSSASISDANTVLNTAVSEVLKTFADQLESSSDPESALHDLIRDTIRAHKRILFSGNGYGESWTKEAEKRGLPNLKTTPDALSRFLDKKNVRLFTENKIFSEAEMRSRYEIMQDHYSKTLHIESRTMIDMAKRQILPAVSRYLKTLAETVVAMKSACPSADVSMETGTIERLSAHNAEALRRVKALESLADEAAAIPDNTVRALFQKDRVLPAMGALRKTVDEMETMTDRRVWPMPTYSDLLFSIR